MTDLAGTGTPPENVTEQAEAPDVGKPKEFVPGQPDMWAFVLFETLIFAAYFSVYLFFRTRHAEEFLLSQAKLDVRVGIVNTIVLLLSSWAVARCVQAARAGAYQAALKSAFVTLFFGLVFFVSKVFEWAAAVNAGNGPTSDDFFTYYFFFTGIHCLHLVIGFVVLGVVIYQLWSPERRSQQLVETGATYWHTVDFLWVLIFALLYVVR